MAPNTPRLLPKTRAVCMRVSRLRRVWSGSLDATGAFHGAGADPGAGGRDEAGSQSLLLAGVGGALKYWLFIACKLSLYNQATTDTSDEDTCSHVKHNRSLCFHKSLLSADWSHSDTDTVTHKHTYNMLKTTRCRRLSPRGNVQLLRRCYERCV